MRKSRFTNWLVPLSWGAALLIQSTLSGAEIESALKTIQGVSQNGSGQAEALQALGQVKDLSNQDLMSVLTAMDSANPLAANWLRGAFEAEADRLLKSGKLSARDLETFVNERAHEPRVRRLAYEWLKKADPSAEARFIPQMLDDPSPEMRRDAVAKVIGEAQEKMSGGDSAAAKTTWQKALSGAVDQDQFDQIAKALGELGESVNRVQHFGMLLKWHVIGPFDNREMKGFDVAYAPEQGVELQARYEGMKGEVGWELIESDAKDGKFDIAKLTAPHKGAIDYLHTTFSSAANQDVEFRLATANAWKLWVNGELVFAREEYHRGMQFDQYIVRGKLKAGENSILLKICQNEQEQDWAQDWSFQFRICDLSGRALHSTAR